VLNATSINTGHGWQFTPLWMGESPWACVPGGGANHSDLGARRRSGLLRGLMTVHMKAGLAADPIRLSFSQQSYSLQRSPLTTEGVRREFQEAIAELRTDLDAFTPDEARSLMACGYQMASKAYERDLADLVDADAPGASWVFAPELAEITSPAPSTPRRSGLLELLKAGKKVNL
jgi:hypothetical protein